MTLKRDYQRIAHRSLNASEALLEKNIQEKATFMTYHAFESTGCALSESCKLPVGPNISHSKKIKIFNHAAKKLKHEYSIALLTVELKNIRNEVLYPLVDNQNQTIRTPEQAITIKKARELKRRVQGIVNWVDQKI